MKKQRQQPPLRFLGVFPRVNKIVSIDYADRTKPATFLRIHIDVPVKDGKRAALENALGAGEGKDAYDCLDTSGTGADVAAAKTLVKAALGMS